MSVVREVPTRFRKKPVVIDAVHFDGTADSVEKIYNWSGHSFDAIAPEDRTNFEPGIVAEVYDRLHSTWVGVRVGQWIIRGVQGEYYPCDPDVFDETYEAVE